MVLQIPGCPRWCRTIRGRAGNTSGVRLWEPLGQTNEILDPVFLRGLIRICDNSTRIRNWFLVNPAKEYPLTRGSIAHGTENELPFCDVFNPNHTGGGAYLANVLLYCKHNINALIRNYQYSELQGVLYITANLYCICLDACFMFA